MTTNLLYNCIFCEKIFSNNSNLSKHYKTKKCLENQQKSLKKVSIVSLIPNNIPKILSDNEKEENINNELKNISWTKINDNNLGQQYYHC